MIVYSNISPWHHDVETFSTPLTLSTVNQWNPPRSCCVVCVGSLKGFWTNSGVTGNLRHQETRGCDCYESYWPSIIIAESLTFDKDVFPSAFVWSTDLKYIYIYIYNYLTELHGTWEICIEFWICKFKTIFSPWCLKGLLWNYVNVN